MRRLPRPLPPLLAATAIFLFLKTCIADIYVVREDSMRPALPPGTVVLVGKAAWGIRAPGGGWLVRCGRPARGEVVAFADPARPGGFAVKRIAAVPGDVVSGERGALLVNGQETGDRPHPAPLADLLQERLVVPEGTLFVLGDNREKSRDSRHGGVLDERLLLGKVTCVIHPFARFGEEP